MRNPTKTILTVLLALAVACLPLQAFACKMDQSEQMDQSQHMDHGTMDASHMDLSHMDYGDGAGSDCCDPEGTNASGDCSGVMNCGSCAAGNSMISPLPQSALVCLKTTAVASGSGEILPSHSSPPYHPPTS